jgi:hypothetical protein
VKIFLFNQIILLLFDGKFTLNFLNITIGVFIIIIIIIIINIINIIIIIIFENIFMTILSIIF